MKKILHKLHQKPEHHKKSLALGVSFVITTLVFGIWVSTLPSRFDETSDIAKETREQLEDGITPLATVKTSFDTAKKSIEDLRVGISGE